MSEYEELNTPQKALQVNLDPNIFGTFAEIGAGQEVARWFFQVGKASGTIAKAISAYDMTISDDLYGPTDHYVSRGRLNAMLDREFQQLIERLGPKRRDESTLFVFADTVATHSSARKQAGHGWLGIRFEHQPRSEPSEVILHVLLLDPWRVNEQEILGTVGVNLVHAAFYHHSAPVHLIGTLMDDLTRERIEIDMIRFSGPAFANVDNRLMNLQLVEQGLSDAVMFTANGEVVQPSEVLHGRTLLIERGSFRPVTNVTLEMLRRAADQFQEDRHLACEDLVTIMEMSLNNLMSAHQVDHRDFLARVDILGALGQTVMISSYPRFDQVALFLRQYTPNWIAMVAGVPTLRQLLDEKYYSDVDGGVLGGLGRLFSGMVKLYIHPTGEDGGNSLVTAETVRFALPLHNLYTYLHDSGCIESIRTFEQSQLHVSPQEVLGKIQCGDSTWEDMVPTTAAKVIKQKKLFGYLDSSDRPSQSS